MGRNRVSELGHYFRSNVGKNNLVFVEEMSEGMAVVTTWQTIDTEYNADSVEWCPVPDFQDLVLCGTYQLEENQDTSEVASQTPQVRVGRLYMYKLQTEQAQWSLQEVTRLDMPGILDIKWSKHPINGLPMFALVNSVGQLKVFNIQEDKTSVTMVTETEINKQCLGLSLEWNNTVTASAEPQITVSDSTGGVVVFHMTPTGLIQQFAWKAHDFEAWITAFDQWNTNIVFSGGDDCRFKSWDLRMDLASPVISSKRHSSGVTSIQSSPVEEFTLATGSYDEQLLLWDTRTLRRPVSETSLGGGVWRIKWKPATGDHILTATMYNGFHVLQVHKGQDPTFAILHHYTEHQSIAYGADWCQDYKGHHQGATPALGGDNSNSTQMDCTIATCSFYDHILKLWNMSNCDTKT